jgi:hypothetical protein
MNLRRSHKTLLIIALSILIISLLPGVTIVWAGVGINSIETALAPIPLLPPAQGEERIEHPPLSLDDMIVRFGDEGGDLSPQSDLSGVEIVPAAAFVHTGELANTTQADDWYFLAWDLGEGGFVTNDSGGNEVCLAGPVYLPPGSTITSFTVYVYDNSSTASLSVYLDRTGSWGGYEYLAGVQSTGSSTSIQTLTDPSVSYGFVLPEQNYHIDFCLPANSDFDIRVYGARVDYQMPPPPQANKVYVPVMLKNFLEAPINLSVRNETGGTLTYYKIYDKNPQQGGILLGQCPANIPNGTMKSCGTFPSGQVYVQVNSGCGPGSGPVTFPSGTCTRIVRCGRDPSEWQCN